MKTKINNRSNHNIKCPVCSQNKWYITGIRTQNPIDLHWKSNYLKIRKYIFFNMWHPNGGVVEMERGVCKKCGFVIDFPRPSEGDVTKKYEYLAIVEKDVGATKNMSKMVLKQEYKQSREILNLTKFHCKKNSKRLDILDCGGGDGHLLVPMQKEGNNCYIVDYNKYPVNGIIRFGNTLEDIPKNYKFDLIICRHILEHLVAPKKIIYNLIPFLKEGGLIFVEVPIELCNAPRPSIDPITHINFFQERSLRILFELVGFKPLISRKKLTTYHGDPLMTAQILARKKSKPKKIEYKKSYNRTLSLMNSSFFHCLITKIAHPILLTFSIISLLKNNFLLVILKIFEKIIPQKLNKV